MADDDARRDGEAVDEPVVQQIQLDQLQFEAMIAEITWRLGLEFVYSDHSLH